MCIRDSNNHYDINKQHTTCQYQRTLFLTGNGLSSFHYSPQRAPYPCLLYTSGAGGFGGFGGAGSGFGTDGNGSYWYSGNGGEEFSGAHFGGSTGGFSDFFEELFGHRGGANGGRSAGFRGQDYNAELQLSLREAAETHKQVLNVNGKNIRITRCV